MKCLLCLFDKCICQSFWKDFESFFSEKIQSDIPLTPLTISTITFNFKIKYININLDKLVSKLQPTLFTRSFKFTKNARKSRTDSKLNDQMYNSCIIKGFIEKDNTPKELVMVAMKIFHNGSFNITGCRSLKGVIFVIRNLVSLLINLEDVIEQVPIIKFSNLNEVIVNDKSICVKSLILPLNDIQFPMNKEIIINNAHRVHIGKEYHLKLKNITLKDWSKYNIGSICDIILFDVKISMINTDFKIGNFISLRDLKDTLKNYQLENQGPIKKVEYKPEIYHAVKINYIHEYNKENPIFHTRKRIEKMDGEVTISVFRTGSIIITGGKTPKEIMGSYKFIVNIFNKHKEILKDKQISKKREKHKLYIKSNEIKSLNNLKMSLT
jgi:TATA-box binding protein (TBP) (component of TFIID and TFIIIB)